MNSNRNNVKHVGLRKTCWNRAWKWILGLERSTTNYVFLGNTKWSEFRVEAGKRAMMFEERNGKREEKERKEMKMADKEIKWMQMR